MSTLSAPLTAELTSSYSTGTSYHIQVGAALATGFSALTCPSGDLQSRPSVLAAPHSCVISGGDGYHLVDATGCGRLTFGAFIIGAKAGQVAIPDATP